MVGPQQRSSQTARIWAVMGASGTGKGLFIKQTLRTDNPHRLVIWDFMDEYADFAGSARSLATVQRAMLKAGEAGPLRVRYLPRSTDSKKLQAEFAALCLLVYAWEQCTFIAEELANVTSPSWAPPAWRKMSTSGRHAGIHVIGASQTPAMIDKAFLGNCTLVHVSALRQHSHRVAVAQSMDIDTAQVASLQPLEWIEKDWNSNEIRRGRIEPPARRVPRAKQAQPPSPTGVADPSQAAQPPVASGSATPNQPTELPK